MIKAVLLDLDDTLLGNPTEQFVKAYLGLLSQSLGQSFPPEVMQGLMVATHAVAHKRDPLRTNEEAFYEAIAPYLLAGRDAFDPPVAEFYRAVFPGLRAHTTERPFVRGMVEWLIGEGYQVVVATNPFFPRVAIEQRLAWAGLPAGVIPFALVTTLENMHFCKPHPEYYEEILARIGVQADEAIMIGDDWQNDIVPAWQAGLNTFWAPTNGTEPVAVPPVMPDGSGALEDFARLIQNAGWLRSLTPRPLAADQIAPRLAGNLAAVLGAAREVPPHVWSMRPDPEEWSPVEVLCHLEESERLVQRARLETIAREANPFLTDPNPPLGPGMRDCPPGGWPVALAFAAERQKTLDFLAGLPAGAWNRPARHSVFGPTTLLEMASFTAQHDRLHLTQLCQTVGKCL